MKRYETKKVIRSSNVNISGTLNPTVLKENNIGVLTEKNIVNNLNADGADKVPSVRLLKNLLKNLNISVGGNGEVEGGVVIGGTDINQRKILEIVSTTFLKNFLDEILKEKLDKLSKSNILIDANSTPELVGDDTRFNLIQSSNIYIEVCDEIEEYINDLLDNNYVVDEEVEDVLNTKYSSYKEKLSNLSKDTQIATNRLAQLKANLALEEANKHTNNIANQIVYKLEIHSSNGSIFKKGTIDTTLTAILYKGKDIITEEFNPINFKWTRKSHDSISDDRWNSSARRDYSIKITNKDVLGGQCTFNCEVLDENGNRIVSAF